MVRIEGPVVRLMEGAFSENFVETLGPVTPARRSAAADSGRAARQRDGAAQLADRRQQRSEASLPADDRRRAPHARHLLRRTSSPTNRATGRSAEARRRGVAVRLLVEGDLTDAMPVKYASRDAYQRLLDQGIEIYEYQPTMMHAKAMVVDGVWSMFGSANFDNRSLELNDEMNVAVSDRGLAARLLQDFEQDLRAAHEAGSRAMAPALVPRQSARALLELLRGDFLGRGSRIGRERSVPSPRALATTIIRCLPASGLRRRRPAISTSAAPARRCSTGCSRGVTAARSCCASRTPTPSDRRGRWSPASSTACAGSGSTGTKVRTSAGRTRRTSSRSGRASTASTRRPSCATARPTTTTGAVRFKVPKPGQTRFDDLVHGAIAFDNEHIEDFVILRSDGQPTYHLSVVVDDIDMAITPRRPRRRSHLEHAEAGPALRGVRASRRRRSRTCRSSWAPTRSA